MNEQKEPIFKKSKAHFDELMMEYSTDRLVPEFFGDQLHFAKEMITEVNNKCNKFYEFHYYLKYRKYTIIAMFFILPLMFLLGVIGFTSEAFILSWFFFAFLFFSMFIFFLILYFLSSKIAKQFVLYSQLIQETIDRYNIECFIDKQLFAYFRTKSIDYRPAVKNIENFNKQPNAQKNQKNQYQTTIKFKFYVQSRLLRIIRNFFWIEFLSFSENSQHQPQIQIQQQNSIPKKLQQFSPPHIQQNSSLKQSPVSNHSAINASNLSKSNNYNPTNKSEISQNNQIMQRTPERREMPENDQIIERSQHAGTGSHSGGKYDSPNVMKFEESSDGKSQKKTLNNDNEGMNSKKYLNDNDRMDEQEQEQEQEEEENPIHFGDPNINKNVPHNKNEIEENEENEEIEY